MKTAKLSWPAGAVVATAAMILAALYFGPVGRRETELQPPVGLRVVRVVDGDTIIVRWRGLDEKVRLLNIDAPERDEPGYADATDALRDLIGGRPVDLEWKEPGVPSRDRFGRLLAFVFIESVHVNVEKVRLGHSRFYTKYGRGRYAKEFIAAEEEATRRTLGPTFAVPRPSSVK